MSVPKPNLYWRCQRCGKVVEPTNMATDVIGKWHCERCGVYYAEWEPVAVLPAAELERLCAMEARVAGSVSPEPHGSPVHNFNPYGCSYCEGWDDAIAAVKGEGK